MFIRLHAPARFLVTKGRMDAIFVGVVWGFFFFKIIKKKKKKKKSESCNNST